MAVYLLSGQASSPGQACGISDIILPLRSRDILRVGIGVRKRAWTGWGTVKDWDSKGVTDPTAEPDLPVPSLLLSFVFWKPRAVVAGIHITR